jgi:hypothetical protein
MTETEKVQRLLAERDEARRVALTLALTARFSEDCWMSPEPSAHALKLYEEAEAIALAYPRSADE